jgi:hypothetical protein
MSIIGAFDVHRRQLTFDYVDTQTGAWRRGRVMPAHREHLRAWLARLENEAGGEFAVEGCTGWRYVVEELRAAGSSRILPSRPTLPRCAGRNGTPRPTRPIAHTCGRIYEAAKCAARPASPDHGYYRAVRDRRRSAGLATLAVARKLARRCYHTLRELDEHALKPAA